MKLTSAVFALLFFTSFTWDAKSRLGEYYLGFGYSVIDGGKTVDLEGDDGVRAELLGWSFPTQAYFESPLEGLPARRDAKMVRMGLLHCDRDGHSSHAPVSSGELKAAPVDAWFLGHIHIPDREGLAEVRPMGYLGCLSPIRSKEVGWHGPWLANCHHVDPRPLVRWV